MSLYCGGCKRVLRSKEKYYEVREHITNGVRRIMTFHDKCFNKENLKKIKQDKIKLVI